MNKVHGKKECFNLIRPEKTRTIIGYEFSAVDDDYATWREIYLTKKQNPTISLNTIKTAVIEDINAQTDEKILSGLQWRGKSVWLSSENQFNFKAAYDVALQTGGASLPIKFKLGEDEQGNPVYHVFDTLEEFTEFHAVVISFIQGCLNEGWERKDGINWEDYEVILNSQP